ncbi:MAG: energy transducer TonB, partial [Bacteroidales bacterium]|nr:energy transducer TonB [Bacteroidales bacterium]
SDGLLSDKRINRINQKRISKELEKEASTDKVLFSTCSISSKVIGRTAVSIDTLPDVEFTEEGFVTVKVTVDESGSVISSSIDTGNSTIKNRKIRTACKTAAQKAKFSTGSSAKARGTITYTFSE